ncbi:hypothetical protein HPP92_009207 [Vanilla planifolia]|uniref:Uncharacterized protein n=1 Tax=Vanilla planifolia TaxID=51239 RepID=A0A835V4P6_VANPL|nr:hypothetical protein HPP92_009411 [Vanilla planifolia]KAG0487112.1 hypothetical protein HPP92_009207 [Vanilla planifolia]
MAPMPSPPTPVGESTRDGLVSSAFRLHSKPPVVERSASASSSPADHLIKTIVAAVADHPWIRHFLGVSTGIGNFFTELRFTNPRRSGSSSSVHNFAAILPGDSVAGLVVSNGITNFLNIYNTLLVVRLVLTWFPNSPPAIVSPLSTICDPYLNIFRGIIPPIGGTLDLSPILAFMVLNVFTSTAAALPAELPLSTASQAYHSASTFHQNLSSAQDKWFRRLISNRRNNKC